MRFFDHTDCIRLPFACKETDRTLPKCWMLRRPASETIEKYLTDLVTTVSKKKASKPNRRQSVVPFGEALHQFIYVLLLTLFLFLFAT